MDGAITVAEVIIMDGAEAEATITDGIIAIGDCRPRNQRSADTLPVIEMDASAAVSDRALDRKQREMAAKGKRRSRASCSASRTRQRTSATAKPSWNQLLSCRCLRRRKQRRRRATSQTNRRLLVRTTRPSCHRPCAIR